MGLSLQLFLRSLRNGWRFRPGREKLQAILLLAAAAAFLYGLHRGFLRIFLYLRTVEIIGGLILWKMTAIAFLGLFALLAFSAFIASFPTVFFARDLEHLFSLPIREHQVLAAKLGECGLRASWMVLAALLPYLTALAAALGRPAEVAAGAVLFLPPYFVLAAAAGAGLGLILMSLFPSRRTQAAVFFVGILALIGIVLGVRWAAPERLLNPETLQEVAEYLAALEKPTAVWLPSWWASAGLWAAISGNAGEIRLYGLLSWAVAGLAVYLLLRLGGKPYGAAWRKAQGTPEAARAARPTLARWVSRLPVGRSLRALLGKDVLIFLREPTQWSQLFLLAGLVLIHWMNLQRLRLDTEYFRVLVGFLNIWLLGFLVAAVCLRFAFPAVSLEGESLELVRALPVSSGRILLGKWLLVAVPLVGLAGLLAWGSDEVIRTPAWLRGLSIPTAAAFAFTLSAAGVGFGAAFANLRAASIQQIETSFGGMAFGAAALFFVSAVFAVEAGPVRWLLWRTYFRPEAAIPSETYLWIAGLVGLHLLAAGASLWWGSRCLRYKDYPA